ncbi:hypothetical protein GJAV_G00072260 [Gymnothorax javanicus]|nr:hypothetical protein GJAV_G00072260 [Gymnothorax javanicus]
MMDFLSGFLNIAGSRLKIVSTSPGPRSLPEEPPQDPGKKTMEMCILDTLRYAPHRVTQVDNAGGPSLAEDTSLSTVQRERNKSPTLLSEDWD